jgi:hypothetical protein
MATTLPEYGSDPVFKGTIDDVVAAGTQLAAAVAEVTTFKAGLANARGSRDTTRFLFDKAYYTAVNQVERYATKAPDLVAAGFLALDVATAALAGPSSIEVAFDPKAETIDIHVRYPKGVKDRCVIAISPDPVGPATYVELLGHGRKQHLGGYAPGTWWVRACSVRAKARSAWVGPVSVIVK